ncbi:hypothetical protein [Methylomonas koyamae]|nr:hypothetical protein [Methylomonas koyamae]
MAKLSKEQWADIRRRWEADERDGHQWLADELTAQGYEVNRATIAKAASRQGWAKRGPENVTPKNVTQSDKTSRENVTQNVTLRDEMSLTNVTPAPTEKPAPKALPETVTEANPEPEWEKVDEAESRRGGRPSMYMPHFDRQAYQLCLLGATDSHLAEFFMVTEQTINNWKKVHVTFFESIRNGKMLADAGMAERLYQRGMGYACPDTHVAVINNEIVLTELVKHYPPDTKAAFLWLKNRQPTLWRDKIEIESTAKLDPEMMARIKTEFVERMAASRDRQRQVLIERGYLDAGDQ